MRLESYAQRLLNPFRGVMNIIEYKGAEAVTIDGLHWDIYVRNSDLVEDLANSNKVQTSDIRYGSWSETEGLKRGALYPSDDFKLLEQRGALVYEHLLKHHKEVPFPLKDHIELWLLDTEQQPLGLLDSVIKEEDIELDCRIDWRAGLECERSFHTPAMLDLPPASDTLTSAGKYLTGYINALAGATPQAQWFRREPDGAGTGLGGINLARHLAGRTLQADAFPAYFLSASHTSPCQQQLIRDFLDWQAPCLLLLQNLDPASRAGLEQLAGSRALAVDRLYRLYPDIIDSNAIQAARVEAALRKSISRKEKEDETLSTYYIELNVTRTN